MGLMLLSRKIEPQGETLKAVTLASVNTNLRLTLAENSVTEFNAIELYLDRGYGRVKTEDLEYFYMDIHSENWVDRHFKEGLIDVEINSQKYYVIAGTDQAHYDHLIYDFSLAYLRLNPNQCISLYGETFFFLKDMERLESSGGYYKDWCYKPLDRGVDGNSRHL